MDQRGGQRKLANVCSLKSNTTAITQLLSGCTSVTELALDILSVRRRGWRQSFKCFDTADICCWQCCLVDRKLILPIKIPYHVFPKVCSGKTGGRKSWEKFRFVWQHTRVCVNTALMICIQVYVTVRCLSVRLSVPSVAAVYVGLLLWSDIDHSGECRSCMAHSSTTLSSRCDQCHVVSWCSKLNTDLLFIFCRQSSVQNIDQNTCVLSFDLPGRPWLPGQSWYLADT